MVSLWDAGGITEIHRVRECISVMEVRGVVYVWNIRTDFSRNINIFHIARPCDAQGNWISVRSEAAWCDKSEDHPRGRPRAVQDRYIRYAQVLASVQLVRVSRYE